MHHPFKSPPPPPTPTYTSSPVTNIYYLYKLQLLPAVGSNAPQKKTAL